eukprot:528299-Pyramimonas_sp.AAC.1
MVRSCPRCIAMWLGHSVLRRTKRRSLLLASKTSGPELDCTCAAGGLSYFRLGACARGRLAVGCGGQAPPPPAAVCCSHVRWEGIPAPRLSSRVGTGPVPTVSSFAAASTSEGATWYRG